MGGETDKPAPLISERKQKGRSVGGLGCGATWSAGPVKLVGPTG
jgi:hypothetical protein